MKNKTRLFFIYYTIYQALILLYTGLERYYPNQLMYISQYFMFSIFAVLTIFQFILLTREISRDAKLAAELRSLKQQQSLKEAHSQAIWKRRHDTHAIQQDIKEKLTAFHACLQANDYSNATAYFHQISQEFRQVRFRPCCSDSLLNAILDSKRQAAENHGIQIHYNILLPQDYKSISSFISCIFFNLIDNGIESCIRSGNPASFLTLTTKFRGDFLTIHMVNSKKADEPFSYDTSKEDSIDHGFGLSIIEETARKYNGSCQWLDHGETFESIILLQCLQSATSERSPS